MLRLACVSMVVGLVAACSDGPGVGPQDPDAVTMCADGIDNDLDGAIDGADPDCTGPGDNDEYGIGTSACMDGMDNDGDGKTDYPDDPGCLAPQQDSGEEDDCPSGPNCPECGNGVDDDGDSLTDFAGGDTGCTAAGDREEFAFDPAACGAGTSVSILPNSGTVSGTLAGTSNVTTSCGGPTVGAGPEVAYVITLDRPATLVATTDFPGTTFDTVLYLRRACTDAATQLACSDDITPGTNPRSNITVSLAPGSYYLVVDAKTAGSGGAYVLIANLYVGLGESCIDPEDCAPGFVCRLVPGDTEETCDRPVCSDMRDDDADGLTDYPVDPGCTTPADSTEEDPCPGAGCPACGNGLDDDGDGQFDYPDDVSCTSASGTSEADCPVETDPLLTITSGSTTGTTVGATSQFDPTCGGGFSSPDRVHMLYVRAPLAGLVIDTNNSAYDTTLVLQDGLCSTSIACDDDAGTPFGRSRLSLAGIAMGSYAIVIDGYGSGAYNLNVRGNYGAGAACDPDMPMFTCPTGYACTGLLGAATCQPAACNDTVDADGDGLAGFPDDPGCTSTNDGDETDDCPAGPTCPQCGNGDDDDGDGQTDYPDDPGCLSAAGANEECVSTDPVRTLTSSQVTNQSTAALANDFDLSCGGDGRDEVYRVTVDFPINEIRADTNGSSMRGVVAIKSPSCSTFDLQCDDDFDGDGDSEVFLVDPQLGEYYVIVDDENQASPPPYNLRVSGRYLNNGRCNPTSVFTCNTGFSCSGAPGAETCVPAACNDTVDADGDGFPGYPTDPGCTSTSDGDETDNCPSGPGCPACSNDLDDDSDGFTDYPNDPACAAASVNSELAPCTSAEPVLVFSSNVVNASTAGHLNDVTPSCGGNGRDDIYRLFVSQPLVNLTVDTLGSDISTSLALRVASCNSADLACGVNNFGNGDSRIQLSNVAVGEYFVIVDDQATSLPTTYNLNVSGTLAAGNRCTPGSTSFICTAGYTCGGTAGSETCVPTVCNDTVDADGDGRPGYPSDPGCTSTSDTDESDNCPSGPGCPVCANGLDDDGDTRIDYPMDLGCTAASGSTELECTGESDPIGQITMQTTSGNTTGAVDDFPTICGATGAEHAYLLTLPVPVQTLVLDTENSMIFDTVLTFTDSTCGTHLACDDDAGNGNWSMISRSNVAAGTYGLLVEGYFGAIGGYTINVRGTVAAGQPCTHSLFASGVLACAGTCNPGMGVCQ